MPPAEPGKNSCFSKLRIPVGMTTYRARSLVGETHEGKGVRWLSLREMHLGNAFSSNKYVFVRRIRKTQDPVEVLKCSVNFALCQIDVSQVANSRPHPLDRSTFNARFESCLTV